MRLKTIFAVAALTLAACGQSSDAPNSNLSNKGEVAAIDTSSFDDLLNASFEMKGTSEANLTDLVAALPENALLSWDAKAFDEKSGATVFTGLKIGYEDEVSFGLQFEEASVWGLETDLLAARLKGERLFETGQIYTRFEGQNMAYYGLDSAFNHWFGSLLEMTGEDLPEGTDFRIGEVISTAERIVSTNASLRPWELSLIPASKLEGMDESDQEPFLNALHLAQHVVAIGRSVGYNDIILENMAGKFAMTQPGAVSESSYEVPFVAYRGASGFDLDYAVSLNSASSQTTTYKGIEGSEEAIALSPFPDGLTLSQETSQGSSSIRNVQLDKIAGYFARGEVPSIEERDLMSLGDWDFRDTSVVINEKPIFSLKRGYVGLSEIEWAIPSKIEFQIDDATLETSEIIGVFMPIVEAGMRSTAPVEDAETQAQFDEFLIGMGKALELMPDYDLDEVTFDVNFLGTWNADEGATRTSFDYGVDGFSHSKFDIKLDMPTYAAVKTAYESEDQEAALEAAFEDAFTFYSMSWSEEDKGGLDKIFGFAHAIGKEYSNEGWGAMLAGMEPDQMRKYVGMMLRMAGTQGAMEFPQAADWMNAYASFYEEGGKIEFSFNPPTPINKALADQFEDETEPEEIVKILGLEVTHTK